MPQPEERSAARASGVRLCSLAAFCFALLATLSAQMANPPGGPKPALKAPAHPTDMRQHPAKAKHKPSPAKAKVEQKPVEPPPAGDFVKAAPPDLMAKPAVAPDVEFKSGQLSIEAPNSDLAEVFRAVQRAIGATVEGSRQGERVVVRLGPGPPTEILIALLDGSHYDYVMLGKAEQPGVISRIMLTPRQGEDIAPVSSATTPGTKPAPNPQETGDEVAEPEPPTAEEQQPAEPQGDQPPQPGQVNPRMMRMPQPQQQPPLQPPDNMPPEVQQPPQ